MIIRESFNTEITRTCDVLVCGGGVAGIAAAVAAAECGKRVILAERCFILGGLATAGLVTTYLPICDGLGRQVSFGLAERLLHLSIEHWHDDECGYKNWIEERVENDDSTPRYMVHFNPHYFALSSEELLLNLGVTILYGTTAVAASSSDGRLDAVIFEHKSGRFAVSAESFVDATGDADLAVFTGVPTVKHPVGNVSAAWYYFGGKSGPELNPLSLPYGESFTTHRFDGIGDLSEFTVSSHRMMFDDLKQRGYPEPATMASIPQLRMTRRIVGEYEQSSAEVHRPFEDSVGLVPDWRKRYPVYEVPFRTLYNGKIKNLLFAGRITSCDDDMWDIMRVIPCCAVTGEAVGVAAAMGGDITALDIPALQEKLSARGVKIHEREITSPSCKA